MPAKNSSNSRGLPDSIKQGFNFNRPNTAVAPQSENETTTAPTINNSPTAAEDTDVSNVLVDKAVNTAETANTIKTANTAVNKGGRPRGREKTKKTFYLATGLDSLRQAQVELVKQANLFIKDESEVVDLGLAVLAALAEDKAAIQKIVEIYHQIAIDK